MVSLSLERTINAEGIDDENRNKLTARRISLEPRILSVPAVYSADLRAQLGICLYYLVEIPSSDPALEAAIEALHRSISGAT
jgi:hypothetical protein